MRIDLSTTEIKEAIVEYITKNYKMNIPSGIEIKISCQEDGYLCENNSMVISIIINSPSCN